MLAIDEVYWTVSEDKQKLTVSTEPPLKNESQLEFEPEPRSYRLPVALGLFSLANLGDAVTTIQGVNLGADEVNPLANSLFNLMGVTAGVLSLKLLLVIMVSLIMRYLWNNKSYRYTALSLIYFAIGVYSMVSVANWYTLSALTN